MNSSYDLVYEYQKYRQEVYNQIEANQVRTFGKSGTIGGMQTAFGDYPSLPRYGFELNAAFIQRGAYDVIYHLENRTYSQAAVSAVFLADDILLVVDVASVGIRVVRMGYRAVASHLALSSTERSAVIGAIGQRELRQLAESDLDALRRLETGMNAGGITAPPPTLPQTHPNLLATPHTPPPPPTGAGSGLGASGAGTGAGASGAGVGLGTPAVSAPLQNGGGLNAGRYAQTTYSGTFSAEGTRIYSRLAGRPISTIDDLVAAIRAGHIRPSDIPVNYIVRPGGNTLLLNTRTSQALERAGIPRSQWNAVNATGNPDFERLLSMQLQRNNLTNRGTLNPVVDMGR